MAHRGERERETVKSFLDSYRAGNLIHFETLIALERNARFGPIGDTVSVYAICNSVPCYHCLPLLQNLLQNRFFFKTGTQKRQHISQFTSACTYKWHLSARHCVARVRRYHLCVPQFYRRSMTKRDVHNSFASAFCWSLPLRTRTQLFRRMTYLD